ncbi:rhodanese-like domain-containing protein [Vandammella animalimorsus]|uniref:Sulfurtransferase n=1 Tax=Vandammella animalimorsus TaxID=2029117 RepID=A0A2A2AGS7_9BURK|nr:rhodanese-like domain-containing protein [Vandammella animalimorsus]PAT37780.1 sulfurtransferase [Vandammella animalimorsus]
MSFFLDNWYLFVLAIGSGAMLFLPALARQGTASITPAQAVQKMNAEKAVVIDVRSSDEYASGHVKGARHITADALEQQLPQAVKNKAAPVLFICASGPRAQRALLQAKKLGYENGFVIAGGTKAWRDAGLPLATGAKAG